MKILLDHNLPHKLRPLLPGHGVFTAKWMGWDSLANGVLLGAAAAAGFGAMLTVDKKMHAQNESATLALAVICLEAGSNKLADIQPFLPFVLPVLAGPLPPGFYFIKGDGTVVRP